MRRAFTHRCCAFVNEGPACIYYSCTRHFVSSAAPWQEKKKKTAAPGHCFWRLTVATIILIYCRWTEIFALVFFFCFCGICRTYLPWRRRSILFPRRLILVVLGPRYSGEKNEKSWSATVDLNRFWDSGVALKKNDEIAVREGRP